MIDLITLAPGFNDCGHACTNDEIPWVTITQPDAKVFRNTNFKKRDYEATNIVAAEVLTPAAFTLPSHYELTDHSILDSLTPLWIEGGIRYWGWL